VQAINDFAGAVVLISHDPHLIELTVDRFWLVRDGQCRQFDGDLADYRELVLAEDRPGDRTGTDRNSRDRERRQPRAESQSGRRTASSQQPADRQRQLEQSALAIDKLSQALALIERKLADPALYNESAETIGEWQRKHADVSKRLSDAEEAWLRAQESADPAGA
jgi:ATP-binding cassette subfamily F protein 3